MINSVVKEFVRGALYRNGLMLMNAFFKYASLKCICGSKRYL